MNERTPKASRFASIMNWQTRLKKIGQDLWHLDNHSKKRKYQHGFRFLRILVLAWQGQRRNQLQVQSAALTFYSMIGIGPLIAFSIMISGFLLEKDMSSGNGEATLQESVVVETITKAISFAAPQVALQTKTSGEDASSTELAPEVLELINNFSDRAKSGAIGVVGSLMLLFVGIQVLTSIEKSFNTVWGVKKGRNLPERIVTYWTFISLGAVLGTAALSLLTANAILSAMETLPFGETLAALFKFSLPLLAFLIFTLALAIFYRFIPNTEVRWRPALIGSLIVTAGLHGYQIFSVFYVQRVVDTKSLYGSVGIIIILMLGLYIFWLLILYGGQIIYAIQNADHLTNENAWQQTSQEARETISLAILLLVARRFKEGEKPLSSRSLQQTLRIPFHILNSSINSLCELGYLNPVQSTNSENINERAFQPALPLESITIDNFKQNFDQYGNNEGIPIIARNFPVIQRYLNDKLARAQSPQGQQTLLDCLHEKHEDEENTMTSRD